MVVINQNNSAGDLPADRVGEINAWPDGTARSALILAYGTEYRRPVENCKGKLFSFQKTVPATREIRSEG